MKRVFLKLIRNAFDAMSNGGRLTVHSRRVKDNVVISFSDTGVGMSTETIENLWTPLFTTKAKGMGLGLPIAKRLVETHGGTITVESKAGEGSTFTIILPLAPSAS
jgi:signal transduction histidine kinase